MINLNERIYEVNFGYNAKMEVYTNLSSDIPELYEIPNPAIEKGKYLKVEKMIQCGGKKHG